MQVTLTSFTQIIEVRDQLTKPNYLYSDPSYECRLGLVLYKSPLDTLCHRIN